MDGRDVVAGRGARDVGADGIVAGGRGRCCGGGVGDDDVVAREDAR